MKKVLAILLLLSLCLGLCACDGGDGPISMDTYKKNLGSDYEKTQLSNDDLQKRYADVLSLKVSDYDVKDAFVAIHKENETGVVVIECGSDEIAGKLQDDLGAMIAVLREKYDDSFHINWAGVYILCGAKAAVSDATGYEFE